MAAATVYLVTMLLASSAVLAFGTTVQVANSNTTYAISCSAQSVNITIWNSTISGLNVGAIDHVTMLNSTNHELAGCTATTDAEGNYLFTLVDGVGECTSSQEEQDDVMVYTYTAYVQPDFASNSVSRDSSVTLQFTCSFNRDQNLTLAAFAQIAEETEVEVRGVSGASLNLQMLRYTDATYVTPSTSDVTTVGEELYLGVKIVEASYVDAVVQIVSCDAVAPSPHQAINLSLIANGCAADGEITIDSNYEDESGTFRFTSFYWSFLFPAEQSFNVDCTVVLCSNSDPGNNCTSTTCPTSGRRRRKRTADVEVLRESFETKVEVGPFRVRAPPRADSKLLSACDKDAMGCSHDCAIDQFDEFVCICPPSFRLSGDAVTCLEISEAEPGHVIEVDFHTSCDHVIAMWFVVVAVAIVVFVWNGHVTQQQLPVHV